MVSKTAILMRISRVSLSVLRALGGVVFTVILRARQGPRRKSFIFPTQAARLSTELSKRGQMRLICKVGYTGGFSKHKPCQPTRPNRGALINCGGPSNIVLPHPSLKEVGKKKKVERRIIFNL